MYKEDDDIINLVISERNYSMNKLKEEIEDKSNLINRYREMYQNSQREISIKINELNRAKNEKSNLQFELNNIRKTLESTQNELKSTQDKFENSKSELEISKIQLQEFQFQLQDTLEQLNNRQTDLYKTQNMLKNAQDEFKNEIQKNNELMKQIDNLNQIISKNENYSNALKNEIYEMRNKNEFNNNKVVSLTDELKMKEEEKNKLLEIIKDGNKLNKLLTINFKSVDGTINETINCHYYDSFSKIEDSLYQAYPNKKNINNYYLYDGKTIDKNGTILYNNIQDQAYILIYLYEI